MVKATSLLVLISRFIAFSWRVLSSCAFYDDDRPAIVVITTINFDSLSQPQDSLFPWGKQQLTGFPIQMPKTFSFVYLCALGGKWFRFPSNTTTASGEIIRVPDAAYNL